MQLWEQADKQGSSDAAMNLGVMYSQGLYPGKAADKVRSTVSIPYGLLRSLHTDRHLLDWDNEPTVFCLYQFMAYTYYLKSAQRGNIDGSIQLADVWTTGIPGRVKRRPADAVLLVSKFISFF